MLSHESGTRCANEMGEEFLASEIDIGFWISDRGCFRVEVRIPDESSYTHSAIECSGMASVRLRNEHKMRTHFTAEAPATVTYSIIGNFVM
jgi:hypothetical protein